MEMPAGIRDVAHLEELLSEPSDAAIEAIRRADGDLIVLGVAGKMGPTLARMARRAMDAANISKRVIGVSRFSSPDQHVRKKRKSRGNYSPNSAREHRKLPGANSLTCCCARMNSSMWIDHV